MRGENETSTYLRWCLVAWLAVLRTRMFRLSIKGVDLRFFLEGCILSRLSLITPVH